MGTMFKGMVIQQFVKQLDMFKPMAAAWIPKGADKERAENHVALRLRPHAMTMSMPREYIDEICVATVRGWDLVVG